MRLPDNRFLAWLVVVCPPLVATALPLLLLRGALFYEILGALAFYGTIQVLWGLYCRGDNDIPYDEPSDPELFL